MKAPQLLDTTLRDGSYVINFQFTARDTSIIAAQLENCGFELIEIGHGIGIGASVAGHGAAAETDNAYLEAVAGTLKKAKWGMFCIPGIATLEQLDVAAGFGMKFVRIGTDVAEVARSRDFIARAKKHGLFVCSNFMKSYAVSPQEFAHYAKMSQDYGTDMVYIVDSAGGMMTDDVEHYYRAVRDICDVRIGFHGHNNLGLGVANAVRAAQLGFDIIDVSLQGMGRSAGNTPTELFLPVMERLGFKMGLDPLKVMDVGEKYIKPLLPKDGLSSLDIVCGYAQFHSSYMGIIREYSSKFNVDPRKLIVALCEKDRVSAPRPLVEQLARELSQEPDEAFSARFHLDRYHGAEQNPAPTR